MPSGSPFDNTFHFFLYKNTKIHTFSKNRFISFSNLFKPLIPIIPVMPFFSDIISKEKKCTQVWSFKSALKLKVTPNIKSKFHRYTVLLLTEVVGGRSIRRPQIPLSTVQQIFSSTRLKMRYRNNTLHLGSGESSTNTA